MYIVHSIEGVEASGKYAELSIDTGEIHVRYTE